MIRIRAIVLIGLHAVLATQALASNSAQVKEIFRTRCFECHGTERQEAGINILDLTSYVGEDDYVTPGNVDASALFDAIVMDDEDARMPEAPLPALEPFEIEAVRAWIKDGANEFPEDIDVNETEEKQFGTEYILSQLVDFIDGVDRADRRYLRFFSSNHLLAAGATPQDLAVQRDAFTKAINHLSWEREIVLPTVVDAPIGSILAVDIRSLGWEETPFREVHQGQLGQQSSVNLYDLVLLDYPYSLALQNSSQWQQLHDSYLSMAQLLRPIPFVRMDWFSSSATQFPLYEDILQLPYSLPELETELGVNVVRNIESGRAHRGGMTVSGVSRNNRVVERHASRYGAYWKSYDFETSRGLQNMFVDPLHFQFAGGEMIWTLPNGLQGYLITDAIGNRIREAPTSIVTDKFAEDKVVRNGLACMRCHDRGMKRFTDNIRPAFMNLPDSSREDRDEILRLYIEKSKMDKYLKGDEQDFVAALSKLDATSEKEPLVPVSRRFLEAPITLSQAAGELGYKNTETLKQIFRLPEFTQLGLAGLTSSGVIRRDTWEDYFDRTVAGLGLGIPIIPIDGLRKRDQLSSPLSHHLNLKTNRASNTFAAGDEMIITVANNTEQDLYIELIGTDSQGKIAVLTKVLFLRRGRSYQFPKTGAIEIQPQLGKENITVFASPSAFRPGTLIRGPRTADRFIHSFYTLGSDRIENRPDNLIKKTITLETR